jgi:hypothetical protein
MKIGESKIYRVLAGDTITLPTLQVGDTVLIGKFKNRRAVINGIDVDKNGQPVLKTSKGDVPVFKFRLEKLMNATKG